ncbi:MAG TPA: S53 family peptidase [Candidatus Nanopelagicaceae bacterium]|nr:S53 family peptidase [Candidatus Nanopelagicaceae bacterium]
MRRYSRLIIGTVAVSTLAAMSLGFSAYAAPSARATITGSVPPWAASAAFKGVADAAAPVGFRIYLGWSNSSGAEALARAVSTPGDPQYGQFLSPAQFRQQFAPSQSDVTAVQQWLHSNGFTVDYTPTNNHYVQAKGTVAEANAAFATTIDTYVYQGMTLNSPATELSVPSDLPNITGVVGLDGSAELIHSYQVTADAPPSAAFQNADPTSAYFGEKRISNTALTDGTLLPTAPDYSFAPKGYTPTQLRGAYGTQAAVASGNDGSGVTVAIIDAFASPTIVDDANQFASSHGEPIFTANQFKQVVAPGTFNAPQNKSQSPQGWYGEETLDVEAVHSMAPGANIVYVGSANSSQDIDAALNHVVDRKLATIVTNSYGFNTEALPKGLIKPLNDTFIQAAIEGIGIYFASGDGGDETGGTGNPAYATADWPATSPWVTAVGGTSLAVGATNNYLFETGWETGVSRLVGTTWGTPQFSYGGGGGTSQLFAQPGYQAGVVPTGISQIRGGVPMRAVPDVSALGDPNTGMLVGQTQTFPNGSVRYSEYRTGGTSVSSPLFAGMMALVEQNLGHPIGFANPRLYSQAGSSAFHDVVQPTQSAQDTAVARADYPNGTDVLTGLRYSVRLFGYDNGLTIHAAPGYDTVTGIGSPFGPDFLTRLLTP